MRTSIGSALGLLTVLCCLGATEARADCDLSKVGVTETWKENVAYLPGHHIFIGTFYYEVSNWGDENCDLLLRFFIDDNETPPGRYSLMNASTNQFINAGDKTIVKIDWNFDSRNYPEETGAQNAVMSATANDRQYIMLDTNSRLSSDDWPG